MTLDLDSLKRAAEGAQKVSAIEGDWTSYWRKTDGEADCGVVASKREGQAYSVCRAPRYMGKEDWKRVGKHIALANPPPQSRRCGRRGKFCLRIGWHGVMR